MTNDPKNGIVLRPCPPTKLSGPLVVGGNVTDFQISPNGQRVVYRADADTDNVFELYSVLLSTSSSLIGDYNGNGIVDAGDYTVWRAHLGQTFALSNRSSANTGPIGAADHNTWKSNFGQTSGSGAATAVPEPGSRLLICLAAIGIGWHSRQRQRGSSFCSRLILALDPQLSTLINPTSPDLLTARARIAR
jgi:hypothetical protein